MVRVTLGPGGRTGASRNKFAPKESLQLTKRSDPTRGDTFIVGVCSQREPRVPILEHSLGLGARCLRPLAKTACEAASAFLIEKEFGPRLVRTALFVLNGTRDELAHFF